MSHALSHWREHYAILDENNYLASHSLGAIPRAGAAALQRYYHEWSTLGITAWDGPWMQSVKDFCACIESILSAAPNSVAPMQNATRGMAAIASCLEYKGERNRIVITDLEFTSFYPFWLSQKRYGAEIVVVKSEDGISIDPETICEAIDERTLLVPTCHVYFRSGAIQDIKRITEKAHSVGAMVLVDGYQAVGTVPVDVKALDVDFYVGGSHKWLCGGAGAAYLYVHPRHLSGDNNLRPAITGWFGLADPFAYETVTEAPKLSDGVFRFLAGTPNIPALYAASEGNNIVETIGVEAIRAVSKEIIRVAYDLAEERDLTIRSPHNAEQRGGYICIDFPHAKAVCDALCTQHIITDYRPECGIRISPHFYNTQDDVVAFFEALDNERPKHA